MPKMLYQTMLQMFKKSLLEKGLQSELTLRFFKGLAEKSKDNQESSFAKEERRNER